MAKKGNYGGGDRGHHGRGGGNRGDRGGGHRGGHGGGGNAGRRVDPPPDAKLCEMPYHFVPVYSELAVTDVPMFHDVQQRGDDHWSGELHCTLTALTPLIAGNYQIEFQHLSQNIKSAYARKIGAPVGHIATDKKLIEPLYDGNTAGGLPARVLLPGTALKGMLRQSLQALLSTPMERVAERTFSFRPNLNDANNIVPAILVSAPGRSNGRVTSLQLHLGTRCDEIVYVQDNARPMLETWLKRTGTLNSSQTLDDLRRSCLPCKVDVAAAGLAVDNDRAFAKKCCPAANVRTPLTPLPTNYYLVKYHDGIDGQRTFARAFARSKERNYANGYTFALLPYNPSSPVTLTISPSAGTNNAAVDNFWESLVHLGDESSGHVNDHPLRKFLDGAAQRVTAFRGANPQQGDLLLLEFATGTTTRTAADVVGIGHHFRHRRRYRDTVHTTRESSYQAPCNKGAEIETLRDILCPRRCEQGIGAPLKLTAARGMFGYVGTEKGEYNPSQPLTFGIGLPESNKENSDFAQLAGRIAINWAVERIVPERTRFLNQIQNDRCLVPLRPLGAPKPSAVETYLTQDRLDKRTDQGTLCTYGDTWDDPAAGQLNGRKFYLHQPNAATEQSRYELQRNNRDDAEFLGSNQAMIARFVSTPMTPFHFTLRFRDLRAWEWGALWLALAPTKTLVKAFVDAINTSEADQPLQAAVKNVQDWLSNDDKQWKSDEASRPLLAHKLGHGRPLGLGSVQIKVDAVRRLQFADGDGQPSEDIRNDKKAIADMARVAVKALAGKINQSDVAHRGHWLEGVFLPWLQVHRYAGRQQFDYEHLEIRRRRQDGTEEVTDTIFNFHTDERKKHTKGRKMAKDVNQNHRKPGGLKSLDQLDKEGR